MSSVIALRAALILFALLVPAIALGGSDPKVPGSEKKVETATADTTSHEEPSEEVLALGREVFTQIAEPQCALCHTLLDAGATGEIGPKLDELKPNASQIAAAVTQGVGVMPAYGDLLNEEQIKAVSAYVAAVARNGGAAN